MLEDVDNNFVESFNSSIVSAREKPFMLMLETIRRMAMARIAERSTKAHNHQGKCTPYVAHLFAAEHEEASLCMVTRSTNGWWESYIHGEPFRVNLEIKSCSCRKWDVVGIPCQHAYGVILKKNLQPEDYVSHWFTTEMWKSNYKYGLKPVRGMHFWPSSNAPVVHEIPESSDDEGNPKKKKPDKKRKKPKHESPTKKKVQKRRVMHCGVCGAAHHNSRFHSTELLSRELTLAQAQVNNSGLSAKTKHSQPSQIQVCSSQPIQSSQPSQSSQPTQPSQPSASSQPAQPSARNDKLVWRKGAIQRIKKKKKEAVDHLSFHCLSPRSNPGNS